MSIIARLLSGSSKMRLKQSRGRGNQGDQAPSFGTDDINRMARAKASQDTNDRNSAIEAKRQLKLALRRARRSS